MVRALNTLDENTAPDPEGTMDRNGRGVPGRERKAPIPFAKARDLTTLADEKQAERQKRFNTAGEIMQAAGELAGVCKQLAEARPLEAAPDAPEILSVEEIGRLDKLRAQAKDAYTAAVKARAAMLAPTAEAALARMTEALKGLTGDAPEAKP